MKDGCGSASRRIRVVLIHHGVEARVVSARPTVNVVASAMEAFGCVELREVWRQPRFAPVRTRELAARRMRQWVLERRWAAHIGVSRRWFLSTCLVALRLLLLTGKHERHRYGRQAFIELVLSAKHSLAWRSAFEDRVDVLVVLEDDARGHDSSAERIRQLVAIADSDQALSRSFIDLAGGVSEEELRLARVAEPVGDGIVRLHRASTNTTCGYIIGRELVARLAESVMRDPASLRHPADWVINRCLMEGVGDPDAAQVLCLHSRPHALVHGSVTGAVASSIRGARSNRRRWLDIPS